MSSRQENSVDSRTSFELMAAQMEDYHIIIGLLRSVRVCARNFIIKIELF